MLAIPKFATTLTVLLTATIAAAAQDPLAPPKNSIQALIDESTDILVDEPDDSDDLPGGRRSLRFTVIEGEGFQQIIEIPGGNFIQETSGESRREASGVDDIDDFERDVSVVPRVERVPLPKGRFESFFLGTKQAATWHQRIDRSLQKKLDAAQQTLSLSPLETKKLRIAAHGDVKHLMDELEDARDQLERVWDDDHAQLLLIASFEDLLLRARQSPFHDNSLFAKTLEGIRRKHRENEATTSPT